MKMRALISIFFCFILLHSICLAQEAHTRYQLIEQLKNDPRGPFERIRWFCKDGTIEPVGGRACAGHGGGVQHGEWKESVKQLRAEGYPVATVFTALTERDFFNFRTDPSSLIPILLERFLISYDDGWIYRQARFYRGAAQIEDEAEAAERLLFHILYDEIWRSSRYLLLREAVRLFPRDGDNQLVSDIRAQSIALFSTDRGFEDLKNKIHSYPDRQDAFRVRDYASKLPPARRASYLSLADKIDRAYNPSLVQFALSHYAVKDWPGPVAVIIDKIRSLSASARPSELYELYAEALAELRAAFESSSEVFSLLDSLQLSVILEQAVFALREPVLAELRTLPRARHLDMIKASVNAIYGGGFMSKRSYVGALAALKNINQAQALSPSKYRNELMYLARVPDFAAALVEWEFTPAITKFSELEPKVIHFIPDRLRSSPLLIFSEQIETLLADANRLNGVSHHFFGRTIQTGLKPINAGLARGTLYIPGENGNFDIDASRKIYLVPHTTAELPPVAGVLTSGEGNSLSHIQLLARNLGIPNVSVDRALLPELRMRSGRTISLAVSRGGRVEIADGGSQLDQAFKVEKPAQIIIDTRKLDLRTRRIMPLNELRMKHSGVVAGPKAANLGELKMHFPEAVTDGIVLPFGIFAEVVRTQIVDGLPLIEWMKREYAKLETLPSGSQLYHERLRIVLNTIRQSILSFDFPEAFKTGLYQAMTDHIGEPGSYGVFVRSDTNVEDLPGFTGAGLNLTIPNVTTFDQILQGILEVWASPYKERAFSWRQAHMTQPEQLYASVILLRTVPVEKSGVMLTASVEDGNRQYLTISANEGIGGVVSSDSAETLLLNRKTGIVRLISQSRLTEKQVIDPKGGLKKVATKGGDRILTSEEIVQLDRLVDRIEGQFPKLEGEGGRDLPADIEFGFLNGRLVLFQIRPFNQSEKALKNSYLIDLDQPQLSFADERVVDLRSKPLS